MSQVVPRGHMDRTDRHDEANNPIFAILQTCLKMLEGQETQALTSSAKQHSQMKREKVFQGQKVHNATRKINLLKLK